MRRNSRRPGAVLGLAALLLGTVMFARTAHAQSVEALATRLAELRAEVESLSEQLSEQKIEARNELQAIARQKSDLEVELDREVVRVQKLRDALDSKRVKIQETSTEGEELAPLFESAMQSMRQYVSGTLPFRRADRLAELDEIEDQMKTGVLTYPRAVVRLWGFVEDEFRMTRESAIFQQTIGIDGDEQLAEVVRLGMTMLFFQTSDGVLGYTTKTPQGWKLVRAGDAEDRKQIRALFETFKRQIRAGFFQVPNALPMEKQ